MEDGRSFVRRSVDKYQVIQATLVDTWASTAAGAFALSENSLYTTDAMRDYLSHLTNDGLVAFTRWGFDPPRESLRLVSLAIDALGQLGEAEPWRHVIVGREGSVQGWGAKDTVLISRKPFSPADLDRARAALSHMQTVYLPGAGIHNHFTDLLSSPDPARYQRDYIFDISPITDNRPFFFYTVQPRDLWSYMMNASHQTADYKVNKAVPLLFTLMAVSLAATALILLLPPLVLGTRLPRQRGVRGFLLYFLFIGAGYILIEVGLIQKFVLFLGHPTYALTVVIFSMLVSSGLGSALSRRILGGSEGRLIKALGCVALLVSLLAVVISSLLTALVGLPLLLKMAITTALIAPLGFVMGMPFPTGLQRLEEWHAPSVRWAWSLNAASSVLGSVGALVLSIYLGLIQTLIAGGMLYLAALAVAARGRANPGAAPGPGRVALAKLRGRPSLCVVRLLVVWTSRPCLPDAPPSGVDHRFSWSAIRRSAEAPNAAGFSQSARRPQERCWYNRRRSGTVTDRVEVNPNVMQGKPAIRGTRIPVELLLRKLAEGATVDDLLDAYPRLVADDIRAALDYAADTIAHEAVLTLNPQ